MIKTAKTENGWVRGTSAADPRIISYKGIPFAAPPVGDLRWKAPQPAQKLGRHIGMLGICADIHANEAGSR